MYDQEPCPVYYRIFLSKEQLLRVVCMQEFDEYDYDQKRFLRDEDGYPMKFKEELEAIDYLNENFRPDRIDPEFLSPNNPNFRLRRD